MGRHCRVEQLDGTQARTERRGPVEQAITNRTAAVNIGWALFTQSSGTAVLDLALEASLNAMANPGIEPGEIDGVVTSCSGTEGEREVYPREVVRDLDLTDCRFQQLEILGGAQCCFHVVLATAVGASLCDNVLSCWVLNRVSGRGTAGTKAGPAGVGPPRGRGAQQGVVEAVQQRRAEGVVDDGVPGCTTSAGPIAGRFEIPEWRWWPVRPAAALSISPAQDARRQVWPDLGTGRAAHSGRSPAGSRT